MSASEVLNLAAAGALSAPAESIIDLFFSTLTSWLGSGAAAIVVSVGVALDATTSVTFGPAFGSVFEAMREFGGELALPFVLFATIQASLRHELGMLARTIIVRAPIALIGSGAAIWAVQEALALTDAISSGMLGTQRGVGDSFTVSLAALLGGPTSVLAGFEGMVLAVVTACAAFLLWLELEVRASAVIAASLFIPLALAAIIWPITAHWIRRLAETLAALILAKVVMVAVLVLAVTSIGTSTGTAGLIEGIALLLLSSLAPWFVFRLMPFAESGSTQHLDGLARQGRRLVGQLSEGRVAGLFDRGGNGGDVTPTRDPIPTMTADPVDPALFNKAYSDVQAEMEAYRRQGDDGAGQ